MLLANVAGRGKTHEKGEDMYETQDVALNEYAKNCSSIYVDPATYDLSHWTPHGASIWRFRPEIAQRVKDHTVYHAEGKVVSNYILVPIGKRDSGLGLISVPPSDQKSIEVSFKLQ